MSRQPARRTRPTGEVAGLASRRLAAEAVAGTLAGEAGLDEILGPDPDPLARAIASATFRRLGTIRQALADRLPRGIPPEATAFSLLATGAAQVLFLNIPDHAAVDLAVRLADGSRRTRHLAGLANAVLRRLARERDEILATAPVSVDVPDWLAARWRLTYGQDRLERIAALHREGAALDLTCRQDAAGWAGRLDATLLPTGSLRVADRRRVPDLPGYQEGAWWVQDAAAALPARLLDVRAGERVLDICAAPGGKTAQLAATGARVTALDRSQPRLDRLADNLRRVGLDAEIVCRDALRYGAEPFDAVLLDAPCSATGTIRRHPDIPWTKREGDVASLAKVQHALLDHAATLVRPGGRLVYCVCSLEPEEGEAQAAAFLERHGDFRRNPIGAESLGIEPSLLSPDGDLRTVPDLWPGGEGRPEGDRPGLDGFFAVSLLRDPDGRPGLRQA